MCVHTSTRLSTMCVYVTRHFLCVTILLCKTNTSSWAKYALDVGKATDTPSTKSQTKFEMKEQPNKRKAKAKNNSKAKSMESYCMPPSFPGITCTGTCLTKPECLNLLWLWQNHGAWRKHEPACKSTILKVMNDARLASEILFCMTDTKNLLPLEPQPR